MSAKYGTCRVCGTYTVTILELCPADFAEMQTHDAECQCPLCRHLVAAEDVVEFKLMEVLNAH